MATIDTILWDSDNGAVAVRVTPNAPDDTYGVTTFDSTNTVVDTQSGASIDVATLIFLPAGQYHIQTSENGTSLPNIASFHTNGISNVSNVVINQTGVSSMAAPVEPVVVVPGAPTAPTKPYRYTMNFKALNNHRKSIVALGPTANAAFAYLTAEATVRGGTTIFSLSETISFAVGDAPVLGGFGSTVDAVIDLLRPADESKRQIQIGDMLASYLITGTKFVNTANADIIALASAFLDEYGVGGYEAQVSSHSLN